MRHGSICILASLIILSAHGARAQSGPPSFDADRGCSHAEVLDQIAGRGPAACRSDEAKAREELRRRWAEFSATSRHMCTAETESGGPPSYVELLVCLDLERFNAQDQAKLTRGR